MKTNNVAVIGAGQIGSRHLQALSLINRPIRIQVVDPSQNALKVARERFNQVNGSKKVKNIEYLNDIEQLSSEIDVGIIATTSNIRRHVIESLLNKVSVRYLILEKVVFQKKEDFPSVKKILDEKNVQAWVNFARRMWEIDQFVKNRLEGNNRIQFRVTGSNWGLGCNALHFVDFFSHLINSQDITLFGDHLDPNIIPSKRKGFYEITGTLTGQKKEGNLLSITSYAISDAPIIIQISNPQIQCSIIQNENNAILWVLDTKYNWKKEEYSFKIPFQSQLSHKVVQDILDTGNCKLANYEDSSKVHVPFLEVLTTHFKKHLNKEIKSCPVT